MFGKIKKEINKFQDNRLKEMKRKEARDKEFHAIKLAKAKRDAELMKYNKGKPAGTFKTIAQGFAFQETEKKKRSKSDSFWG